MIFNQKPGVANADGVTPTTGAGPITYSGGSVDGQPAGGSSSAAPRGPQGGNQGAFPDVRGAQYASPGAAGVTKYGLFSNAGRAPGTPGAFPTLPPGITQRPPGTGQRPPMQNLPPGFQARPGAQRARTPFDAPAAPQRLPGPSQVTGPVNNDPRVLLNALRGGGNSRFGSGTGQTMTGQMGMGAGGPASMQQAPPSSQQNAGLQQQFNQQQALAASQKQQAAQNALTGPEVWDAAVAAASGEPISYVDSQGSTTPIEDVPGDVAGAAGSAAGQALGEGFSSFVDAWNAANPGSNMSYEDFLNIPGFDPSSIMGDVGQNWTSAMDPAAWEQMAQNRLAAANEANMGALNRGERRLADRAGRTGFANTGGVTSQMYNDYAGRGVQAERDIFNDTLMNQMNALQGASGFALGQNAQDQARWALETGMAGHAADQNFGANREDNPSGAAVLGDLLSAAGGAAGGAMGAAGQGAGGIMSLLAIPGVMSALGGL